MFCPKCGLENGDETKFCRGCGANLGGVLASLEGKRSIPVTTFDDKGKPLRSLEERAVILHSRGIRGVFTGVAFLAAFGAMIAFGEQGKIWWLIPLTLALVVFAGSIARFVQASGYKKLAEKEPPRHPELSHGMPPLLRKEGSFGGELQPARSFYDTDDLAATPLSVTERTTNLLHKFDDDDEI